MIVTIQVTGIEKKKVAERISILRKSHLTQFETTTGSTSGQDIALDESLDWIL